MAPTPKRAPKPEGLRERKKRATEALSYNALDNNKSPSEGMLGEKADVEEIKGRAHR